MKQMFSFMNRTKPAIDPVCGMLVDMNNPPGGAFEHQGATYHFCGKGCRLEFEEDPDGYLSGTKTLEM